MFVEDPVDDVGAAGVFNNDAFARLFVAPAMTGTARISGGDPGRASAENEATEQQAGTRRNAQSRHPHVLLIPEETVADKGVCREGILAYFPPFDGGILAC